MYRKTLREIFQRLFESNFDIVSLIMGGHNLGKHLKVCIRYLYMMYEIFDNYIIYINVLQGIMQNSFWVAVI